MRHVSYFTGDEVVTLGDVHSILNRLNQTDPIFLGQLIEMRVSCQPHVARDPFTQCAVVGSGQFQIGLLGIINAFFGVDAAGLGGVMVTRDHGTGRVANFGFPPMPNVAPPPEDHDPTGGVESLPPEPVLAAPQPVVANVGADVNPPAIQPVETGAAAVAPRVVPPPAAPEQQTVAPASATPHRDGDGRERRPKPMPPTSRVLTDVDNERLGR